MVHLLSEHALARFSLARDLFNELKEKFSLTLINPDLHICPITTDYGYTRYHDNAWNPDTQLNGDDWVLSLVAIALHHLENDSMDEIIDTIRHEIAHCVAFIKHGVDAIEDGHEHGNLFIEVAKSLNVDVSRWE